MRRSTAILMLLVLPLTACHKWAAPELGPDIRSDRAVRYDRVRVRTTDESTLVLHRAELRPDSLIGYDAPTGTSRQPHRTALPREKITGLEVRRSDTGATLAVLGVTAGVLLVGGLVCAASGCMDFDVLSGWDRN